jgi:hypothetical protein
LSKLKAGNLVRIASYEKIKETLDTNNCCDGLLFMENMSQFCSKEYQILETVKWVCDEYSKKMLRCRDVFVLKDVICDGKGMLEDKDCDRSCHYFWKGAWLEEKQEK